MAWADDCEAVRQTIALYCQLLDDQRFDAVASLFTEDAELPWQGRTLHGRSEIADQLHTTQEPLYRTRHLPYGSVIDVAEGEAYAWTDVAVTLMGEAGAAEIAWLGRYHDVFRIDGGRWKFYRHVAVTVGEKQPIDVRTVGPDVLDGFPVPRA